MQSIKAGAPAVSATLRGPRGGIYHLSKNGQKVSGPAPAAVAPGTVKPAAAAKKTEAPAIPAHVVEKFAAENHKEFGHAKGAEHNCPVATGMFNQHLAAHGIKGARMASIPAFDLLDRYGAGKTEASAAHHGHVASEHNGVIYDWTARQYDPKAPFPLTYKVKDLPKRAQEYIASKMAANNPEEG